MAPSVSDLTVKQSTFSVNKNIEKHQLQNILALKLFLKVYINMVLFYKKVYPENCFTSKLNSDQIFNLSIYIPLVRHPAVNNYIEKVIDSFVNDILLIKFKDLLEDNSEIILTNDESEIEASILLNDLKFILELIEVETNPATNIMSEQVTEKFVLDFVNFPIDYYQNVAYPKVVTCFRENLVSLNTFLELNKRENTLENFLANGKLKKDRFFKIKIKLPSDFTLNIDSQFDWFYKNLGSEQDTKFNVQLKELEFTDNIAIYSSFEQLS